MEKKLILSGVNVSCNDCFLFPRMLLLNEVPLLETAEELKSLMKNAVAKDENVLLMSVPSLGVPGALK